MPGPGCGQQAASFCVASIVRESHRYLIFPFLRTPVGPFAAPCLRAFFAFFRVRVAFPFDSLPPRPGATLRLAPAPGFASFGFGLVLRNSLLCLARRKPSESVGLHRFHSTSEAA